MINKQPKKARREVKISIKTVRNFKKEHLDEYLEALNHAGVPKEVTEQLKNKGKVSWEHPEFDGGNVVSIYEILDDN